MRILITIQRIWNFDKWWESTETEYNHDSHLEKLMKWTRRKTRNWETCYEAPSRVKWKYNEVLVALEIESRGEVKR